MKIALAAGEASGDALGAGLIQALRTHYPHATFTGLAGPRMIEAGCEAVPGFERLSVMGLVEVLGSLPGLLRLRRALARHFISVGTDCFIGLDAPDFNLGLEQRLRAAGVTTAHCVSPTVWAWRPGRVHTIARACDCVLCLYPFEPEWYRGTRVDAVFTGHPLADEIPLAPNRDAARRILGLQNADTVIALLPGSRQSEVQSLAPIFMQAATLLHRARSSLRFIVPVAADRLREPIQNAIDRYAAGLDIVLLDRQSHRVLASCDLALLASGTATLEAMLLKCPMVVAYRVAPLSHFLLKRCGLLPLERYALPNILAGCELVPELMQSNCTPENLKNAALEWLDQPTRQADYAAVCEHWHRVLRCNASFAAAQAIVDLLKRRERVA